MRGLRVLRHRLRSILRPLAVEDELEREVQAHLEALTREHVARGLGEADARLAARRAFGSAEAVKEQCRDHRRTRLLEELARDTSYAARVLLRSPAFALTAILSLALGIGANTAIYSLIDAVLLRLLPVERPHELVFIRAAGSEGRQGAPPYPCFERLRAETTAFAGFAAFAADELRVEVDGSLEQVFGQVVSGSYFDLLGLKPAAGRLMLASDESLDPPVAVIGYGYWQRRFGGRPDAVGRTLSFRERVYTIIGVTPHGFWGLHPGREVEVTLPITQERALLADSGAWWFDAVARLRPGASAEQAAAQADAVFQSFMRDKDRSPEMRGRHFDHIELAPAGQGLDRLRGRFSTPLLALALAAALMLLVACANLACLLLARGAARAHEIAIRRATGAGSGRLLRQLLTEAALVFLLGGAAGLLVARLVSSGLTGFFAVGRSPVLLDVRYDFRLAGFAFAVALACGLGTGLLPALRLLRAEPRAGGAPGARVVGAARGTAARILVCGQVALSLVLLVAAALFVSTIANLRAVDLGFRSSGVLTLSLDPVLQQGPASAEAERFWTETLERVRAIPGVRSASLSVLTPLSGRDTGKLVSASGHVARSDWDRIVILNHVSEGYLDTFAMTLRAGRALVRGDAAGTQRAAVVNETAARAFFGGRDPIGQTLDFGRGAVYHVVGVVADHKHLSVREPAPRLALVPLWQRLDPVGRVSLAVSSDRPTAELARAVTREVRAVHPSTLVSDVIRVEDQVDAVLLGERLLSSLAAAFAALAVTLAAIGLFGTLSYAVARRRPEFGVRMALGAAPGRLARGVLSEVLLETIAGIAIGLPAAALVSRTARSLLFGVSAAEPGAYLLAALVLATVAALAGWLPARRAAHTDPARVLRAE